MQTPESHSSREPRPFDTYLGAVLGAALIPFAAVGALLAAPSLVIVQWMRQHREHSFRMRMKSRGRLMPWGEFVRTMRGREGTCIEERFSPKGPVRFWWTPENVQSESPYPIIDWFNMRKGQKAEPFIHWCRQRYTAAEDGSAVLVDTGLVARADIYAVWSLCRSESAVARWVEVAPPEIVPHKTSG